jgi:hypothetical protein
MPAALRMFSPWVQVRIPDLIRLAEETKPHRGHKSFQLFSSDWTAPNTSMKTTYETAPIGHPASFGGG